MTIKKILVCIIFLSLSSCGYESIFSKKNNTDIIIKKIEMSGNKNINRKVISLVNLKENKNKDLGYTLWLDSSKIIEITAKDKAGNASIYKTTITVNLSLNEGSKIVKTKLFNYSFSYNNLTNKFDLSQYQKNIEMNLINEIAEEILIYMNS